MMLSYVRFVLRQLLPVVKGGNRAEIVNSCIKSSPLWSSFQRVSLTVNVRLSRADCAFSAQQYDEWLSSVGNGWSRMMAVLT